MNWNRDKNQTLECPFDLRTRGAYDWFVRTVGDRPIRWTGWYSFEESIFIKDYEVLSGRIKDKSNQWWNICGGFSDLGVSGERWEFADEI